jgi:phage tail-like protein
MKKTALSLIALALMALVTTTSAFADGPTPGSSPKHRLGEYNFLLEVSGITPDQKTIIGGFKSMSGMDSDGIVPEHRFTSSDPLPPGINYGSIVLKRGYTAADDLWQWRKNIENGVMDKRTLSVIILDQDLETEVARYNFFEAWPAGWYVPDLDSDSSGLAIEKLEIAFEKVERVMK